MRIKTKTKTTSFLLGLNFTPNVFISFPKQTKGMGAVCHYTLSLLLLPPQTLPCPSMEFH